MIVLILGLILFLGGHCLRFAAPGWRAGCIVRIGEKAWKGWFTLAALIGFAMIVWGYGQARAEPVVLWTAPIWTRHLLGLATLVGFVLVAAAYVPGNHMKAALVHPMVLGTAVWAGAHLLVNGSLAGLLLFGAFLIWAVIDFVQARRRDRMAGAVLMPGTLVGDTKAVAIGAVAWAAFAFYLHGVLIGVRPFG